MIDENQDDNARAITFAAVKVIVDELYEINERSNNTIAITKGYLFELLRLARLTAHLDDDGHPDSQHLVWVIGTIQKIESVHGFGPLVGE